MTRPNKDAREDRINEDWAEHTFFKKIIADILLDDTDYVNQVWCDHAKAKISEEFVSKIEKMYKQSEGNCEPTDN